MITMIELWLARHGETPWSLTGQHTGRTDLELTPEGRKQAARLRARLANQSFDKVLTSPLIRARETAKIAGFPDAVPSENLMEWDYGDFEGRTTLEIQKEIEGWSIWSTLVPNGESLEQVGNRADRLLAGGPRQPGECLPKRVLMFAHGHILRILTARWLGLEPESGKLFSLSTASLSVLGYEHDVRVIREWNIH